MEALLLRPIADAFLQVGVPVAVLAALVAWARVRCGTRALDVLVRHQRAAPALGALLGVSPGCGGAILAVGLYLERRASYGTAVAALTATMGDASFVVLALDPRTGVLVHGVLLGTGVLAGYLTDAAGLDPRRRESAPAVAAAREPAAAAAAPALGPVAVARVQAAARPAVLALPAAPAALWVVAGMGTLLAVPASVRLLDPAVLPAVAGVDLWLAVGVAGFVAAAAVLRRRPCCLEDDVDDGACTLPVALTRAAVETAFIVFWVSVAFVVMAVLSAVSPWQASALPLAGLAGVVVGALVAVVPGCGTQIAFTGLYAAGGLPLPALLSNAVAQDGDALLPVLAQDRRTALFTTALTTAPALAVGAAWLALG